jgi:hypothetical protein
VRKTVALSSALISLILLACGRKDAPSTTADSGAAAAAAVGSAGLTSAAPPTPAEGDDVEPVYPVDAKAPTLPLAEKLCEALHATPEKKRAACCNATPGIVMTSECTRTLSAAIRGKAVTVSESDVDACIAAFDATLAGCDWVGPFPPGPPPACRGVVKGAVRAGQKCRSSLECEGSLRCLGAGPTTPGTCGHAKADGEACGGTVDALATFTRDTDLDAQHPECATSCIRHKCSPAIAAGGTCRTTADCASGLLCLGAAAKKCTAAPLPSEAGEACPGGTCGDGLSCIRGKCTARKAGGQACTADFECRGGCVTADGGKHVCGPRCDLR